MTTDRARVDAAIQHLLAAADLLRAAECDALALALGRVVEMLASVAGEQEPEGAEIIPLDLERTVRKFQ